MDVFYNVIYCYSDSVQFSTAIPSLFSVHPSKMNIICRSAVQKNISDDQFEEKKPFNLNLSSIIKSNMVTLISLKSLNSILVNGLERTKRLNDCATSDDIYEHSTC